MLDLPSGGFIRLLHYISLYGYSNHCFLWTYMIYTYSYIYVVNLYVNLIYVVNPCKSLYINVNPCFSVGYGYIPLFPKNNDPQRSPSKNVQLLGPSELCPQLALRLASLASAQAKNHWFPGETMTSWTRKPVVNACWCLETMTNRLETNNIGCTFLWFGGSSFKEKWQTVQIWNYSTQPRCPSFTNEN